MDGFSGKIVRFLTMPIKNNIEIYSNFYRWGKDIAIWNGQMAHAWYNNYYKWRNWNIINNTNSVGNVAKQPHKY